MTFTIIAASLFALQATPQATETAKPEAKPAVADIEVVETKPVKITDKRHPDYVKCKRESVIGSRARKRKVCKTNRQWVLDARDGNKHTREVIEANTAGFTAGG
ncbi:MAG: hypothetical protein AAGK01_08935 [Pseudomonadota bacterium]